MNIFYAPPSQINNGFIELLDQEATHASKVMRVREGDELIIVDGKGGQYRGPVRRITKKSVQVEIENEQQFPLPKLDLVLGMGIIKKRDRLEFAVEKAVELGVSGIHLFRSEHTIKENVRTDRLESIAVSAMKQSLRAWLPDITLFRSFEEMLESAGDATLLVAHEKIDPANFELEFQKMEDGKMLLLVGPEGGFSNNEIELLEEQDAHLISLGKNRLRTETAAVAFLSQFI